ncbi:MAG: cation transporter, partial [Acidimicrobiales bacterium]
MSRARRLVVVLVLNLALVAAQAGVGMAAGSLGVLAEAVDSLGDAGAVGLSLAALRFSSRRRRRLPGPAGAPVPPRANAFAALVNGAWLLVLSTLVVAGAADRLATGAPAVQALP